MARVKIVDTFNGWEGPSFNSREAAEAALAKRRAALYAIPGNQDIIFCGAIVPATYTWYFHPPSNKFIWG